MDFIITNTNIVRVTADAIVLPANRHLKEGSGASRAILRLQVEKNLHKHVMRLGIVIWAVRLLHLPIIWMQNT